MPSRGSNPKNRGTTCRSGATTQLKEDCDPSSAPVGVIGDFFVHLFQEMVSQSHRGPQRGVQTAVHQIWLSSRLAYAYGDPANAHEVWAMVSSWAFFKGAPIEDIIKAACWKSPSTFTSCYLKDVPQQEGRAGHAALMAVKPPSSRGDVSSLEVAVPDTLLLVSAPSVFPIIHFVKF